MFDNNKRKKFNYFMLGKLKNIYKNKCLLL